MLEHLPDPSTKGSTKGGRPSSWFFFGKVGWAVLGFMISLRILLGGMWGPHQGSFWRQAGSPKPNLGELVINQVHFVGNLAATHTHENVEFLTSDRGFLEQYM
jgi:hypothetical protein